MTSSLAKVKSSSKKTVWIAWERHRRTTELAAALRDVQLVAMELDAHRLIRYPYLLLKTTWVMIRELPSIVIVQSPSILLALFAVTVGKAMNAKVVVDAHNEGLRPFGSRYKALMPVYRLIQKRADLTIVTNRRLALEVERNGGNPFVMEDKIPEFERPSLISLKDGFNITYICSFEKDEPYIAVLEAARHLSPNIFIHVTGNYRKAPNVTENSPPNVFFTGYLPDKDYVELLFSCDAVMDLTSMEDCLVCGAYEAISLGKPLILSKTKVNMAYFRLGAFYTDNNPESIAASVQSVVEDFDALSLQIKDLKKTISAEWKEKLDNLERRLGEITSNGQPSMSSFYFKQDN